MSRLIDIITSADEAVRDRALDATCADMDVPQLLAECAALDQFWRDSPNLYERVRAQLFLATIQRYHLPRALPPDSTGLIPFDAHTHYLARRFQEAIDRLLAEQHSAGPSLAVSSALALAYRDLAFQTLANQVRRSVRTVRGNQWMFRLGHPADQPLRLRPELLRGGAERGGYPILRETTAVRMDFSHSGWSDIFFLAMDFPEGARVLNASIDLGVRGRDAQPRPPIETYLRVIDRPVLRLVSLDLDAQAEVEHLPEIFDFARDYLGLLKAAVIAAGVVPPGMEGCELPMAELLRHIVGPGLGLEIVSKVNDIPKGSRLAVSTNLLGSLIALCMRATGQVSALSGPLTEADRRIVAARCILGEWLGGSGGGWQDSGGIWPGIKLICGESAAEGDPEFGVSRGRLLPVHHVYSEDAISRETREKLQNSLVLVHGGMAQNVGPILEMVTEKYLLRSASEWDARQEAIRLLDEIAAALQRGDIAAVGRATTRNFEGPLQQIIPWCTNLFTDDLIGQCRTRFGADFRGFWMLGGMAGGGMGFLFAPHVQQQAKDWLQSAMAETKSRLETSLPFAMQPVVYDFPINDRGTWAELLAENDARLPDEYYAMMLPGWLRLEPRRMTPVLRAELELLSGASLGRTSDPELQRRLLGRLLPHAPALEASRESLADLLARNGFDREQHELVREELRTGRIGLAQNRLPANTRIKDVRDADVIDARRELAARHVRLGEQALADGEAAVVTLAAGVGSRWTEGAGVVKALHPFCRFRGLHRRFVDVHLAKTRRTARLTGALPGQVFTTSYLTEGPVRNYLATLADAHDPGAIFVSPGRSVGLRTVPMVRDLLFAWEEMPQQVLDEQRQKVRASLRAALIEWARAAGEGSDYTDNVPLQCLHPVGHWYEIPNLLRNGTLRELLAQQPSLHYLLLHNIDTLGAGLDPGLLGLHVDGGSCLTYEVISRRVDDRGGGLARVDGRVRLVEGLALPHEEDEFRLSYYNSLTTWITIDRLLAVFGLTRIDLANAAAVDEAVRQFAQRLPTYVTIKDVKKRWGHGQEDVFPVTQFEKLWGDMTVLPEVDCRFVVVPLFRGQQLKHQAQLDGWLRDGSADYVDQLCDW
jgi:hypothetical protein